MGTLKRGSHFKDIAAAEKYAKETSDFHSNLYSGPYKNQVAEVLSNQIARIGTSDNPSQALGQLSEAELKRFTQGFGQDVVDKLRSMTKPFIRPEDLDQLHAIHDKKLVLTADNATLAKLTANILKNLGYMVAGVEVLYEAYEAAQDIKKDNTAGTTFHSIGVLGGTVAIAATSAPVVLTAGVVAGAADIAATVSEQEHYKEKVLSSNARIEMVNDLRALFSGQTTAINVHGFGNNKETYAVFNVRNDELYINNDYTGLNISDLARLTHEDLQNFALTLMNTDFSLQIYRQDTASLDSLGKVYADILSTHQGNPYIINAELYNMNNHYNIDPADNNIALNNSDNHQEEHYHR